MGKLKHSILILGEGPTEFYYFSSLRDILKGVTIRPDYPKHTNIPELEEKISEGIQLGYDHIFCIIDMDTKNCEPERSLYAKLKQKYSKPINKPKKGIYCEVKFCETHRCSELFFLYYFKYTSRYHQDQNALIQDLNQCCEYRKSIDFYLKSRGLHQYFEKKGGSLDVAVRNSEISMAEKTATGRDYTYSELGSLIKTLTKFSG